MVGAERDLLAAHAELRARAASLDRALSVLTAVMASVQDAVIVVDADGRVTDWNSAAERRFGVAADAAVGRNAERLLGAADGLPHGVVLVIAPD